MWGRGAHHVQAQIAAGHDDGVGGVHQGAEVEQGLARLALGDDLQRQPGPGRTFVTQLQLKGWVVEPARVQTEARPLDCHTQWTQFPQTLCWRLKPTTMHSVHACRGEGTGVLGQKGRGEEMRRQGRTLVCSAPMDARKSLHSITSSAERQ